MCRSFQALKDRSSHTSLPQDSPGSRHAFSGLTCLAVVGLTIASMDQGAGHYHKAAATSGFPKPCAYPKLLMVTTQASTLHAALRYGWSKSTSALSSQIPVSTREA